jgi:hypothetical protein
MVGLQFFLCLFLYKPSELLFVSFSYKPSPRSPYQYMSYWFPEVSFQTSGSRLGGWTAGAAAGRLLLFYFILFYIHLDQEVIYIRL